MKNRAFHTPLLYIIPSLPHPVSADYFRIRYRGKMVNIYIYIYKLNYESKESRDKVANVPSEERINNKSTRKYFSTNTLFPRLKTILEAFN